MSQESRHTLFFVDDEILILKALQRLFRRHNYEIRVASNGHEGIKMLEECETPVSMIISDQRMPGMTGTEFLERSKKLYPDAIRFLLTGYSDMNAVVDSVNKGEIHRYIKKPWNDDELVVQVEESLKHYALAAENKRLLEITREQNKKLFEFGRQMDLKVKERTKKISEINKTMAFLNKELELNLFNAARAFASLTEMNSPVLQGHGRRVSRLACRIAEKLGFSESETTQIELASMLHDIGKTGFSEKIKGIIDKTSGNEEEKKLYQKHPEEGQAVIAFINRFDEIGFWVRHHHERYDGSGYPDNIGGDEIPLGSRIIAVADIYDRITGFKMMNNRYLKEYLASFELTRDHLSTEEKMNNAALAHIRKHSFTKYDPDIVKAFLAVVDEKGIKTLGEKKVSVRELSEGMIIGQALYSKKGRFLLPYKTALTAEMIDKLQIIYDNGEIENYIHIIG